MGFNVRDWSGCKYLISNGVPSYLRSEAFISAAKRSI